MKKLRGSLLAKIIAIFLITFCAAALFLSAIGVTLMLEYNGYDSGGYERARADILDSRGRSYCITAGNILRQTGDPEQTSEYFSDTNFRFDLFDYNGDLLFEGYSGESAIWSGSVQVPARVLYENSYSADDEALTTDSVTVSGYILSDMVYDDSLGLQLRIFDAAYTLRYELIRVAVGTLLLTVILFIFLMCAAGHRDGTDVITMNGIDRIPFDLFAAVICCVVGLMLGTAFGGLFNIAVIDMIIAGMLLVCSFLLALMFVMSFATRMKAGGFSALIKSCIIYRALRWCWRLIKRICRAVWRFISSIGLIKKYAVIIAAVLFIEFLFIIATESNGAHLTGWVFERGLLTVFAVYVLLNMRKLRIGASQIAGGNDSYKIDTERMHGELRRHADDLNNIGAGISKAVDERMKSEHFRTELITNVSHDIKTPLTSIVNYVDLLSKEEPENEKMREYIDVLSRQSARLKKLIDDLIEASKASTGNLSVSMERCELGVLLDQTAGEYGERLSKAGLELVLTKPEEPVPIMADGRHMWRVFDNLMNNACKYAQPGTRVYLTLQRSGNTAQVVFRNISRSQLNISGDELMERFVRGDSSRNTEGSGLGLSIARSLVQLQHGKMELIVDGDLFKIVLSFNTVE